VRSDKRETGLISGMDVRINSTSWPLFGQLLFLDEKDSFNVPPTEEGNFK